MIFFLIIMLFIFGCESDSSNSEIHYELPSENFMMPNTLNSSWTYEMSNIIYSSSITSDVTRTIISPDEINSEYSFNCGEDADVIYISSEGSLDYEGDGLTFECNEEDSPSGFCQQSLPDHLIQYNAYSNSSEEFKSCITNFESNNDSDQSEYEGHGVIDVVTKVGNTSFNIFNIVRLDYPLYIGKTWQHNHENLFSSSYEVISEEIITLNIQGIPATFYTYKISLEAPGFAEVYFYISNIGLVKVESVSDEMPVTSEYYPEGTGETFNQSYNIDLINFNIE